MEPTLSAGQGRSKFRIPAYTRATAARVVAKGKVYVLEEPGVLVRLVGQAPITGTVYELEKLRCNLCLEVFTAEAPAEAGRKSTMPPRSA